MSDYPLLQMLIGGKWVQTERTLPVLNPATGAEIGRLPVADQVHLDAAVLAAVKGFAAWRAFSAARRADIMHKAADLLRERVEDIAYALTLEQGKPLDQARQEILRGCDIIDWDAEEGRRAYGRIIPSQPGLRNSVIRQPIGVVAAFSPWNFPFGSPVRKLAGALSGGCSIVLKAAEETPACAMALVSAFLDAGVPADAVNLVFGEPAATSSYLIAHAEVRLVTFTGSVPVGKQLAALAGSHMKPAVMELGGHAPVIVCADADPEAAAKAAVFSKSRNTGQICTSPTRFFVEQPVLRAFTDAFVGHAERLKIGDGLSEGIDMGPVTNIRRLEAIEGQIADATAKGAQLFSGGTRHGNSEGYFYPLSVLADVPAEADAMQTEPFGPLAIINGVPDLDAGIAQANALPYGLAAYAFTRSAANVEAISERVECGNLSINHFVASIPEGPLGGVKDSGYGREGGTEGIFNYTVAKSISHLVA